MARTYRCRKHPRYKAVLKPRIPCPGCWWLFFIKKDSNNILRTVWDYVEDDE